MVLRRRGRCSHHLHGVQDIALNVDAFVELVHEKYPEINLEILPYSGQNTTAWMKSMLRAGELPDIYFTTMYTPNTDPVADKLMDLSGYDFTDNFVQARLREVTVDGAVYMLPLSYSCIAMTANAFSEDVQNCLDAGMNAHVAKPLDIGILMRTLKTVLGGKASGRAAGMK